MSDRGRSRRTARSTKATAPKATPDTEVEPGEEPAATAGAESDKTPAGAAAPAGTAAEETTDADETVSVDERDDAPADAETEVSASSETETETDASSEADASSEVDASSEADADDPDAIDASDASDDPDASDPDASDADGDEDAEKGTSGKGKAARSKAPTPMTKAEKRAAARIAAAKTARRRRTGQAIAGTIIVLLVVGGAFAGVWYFGDRAEKNRVKCKPSADAAAFPPLLGGMNKALATEPKITASNEEIKTVKPTILIKGECKTVKAGQTVTVNYVGATIKDAQIFDASWPRKKTIEIPVGQKQLGKQPQVIEGWDEGLVGLKVGTRVQLDIPGNKAYGDDAPEGYPKGTLRFIVDILDAKDADSTGLPAGLGG